MPKQDPVLVVVVGGVASGKSTLARAIARALAAPCVEADRVREALLQLELEDAEPARLERMGSAAFDEEVYLELLRRADALLETGPVVLDACFARADERLAAQSLARRHGALFRVVECRCSARVVAERVAARDATLPQPSWRALHDGVATRWEPVEEIAPDEHLVVDGDRPPEEGATRVLASLPARRPALGGAPRVAPEAVTFDCWNTLLYEEDWETAHALRVRELRAAAREAGRDVSLEEAAAAFDAGWERHMRIWHEGGATGAREVALWSLAELGLRAPHPALEHLIARFEEASHTSRVLALDGALELLAGLARAGIPCALVCDTGLTPGRVVRGHLERLGLLAGLRVQAFSDEVGVPKPDPRVFRAALEPLGVAPGSALHVGDLRRTDVAGARGLGMGSVRIAARYDDGSTLPEADHVVRSFAELGALLGLDGTGAD